MTLEPEATVYQHALRQWEEFHAASSNVNLGGCLRDLEGTAPADLAHALRILPANERTPVAFGVFLQAASRWSPLEQTVFLGEFLPRPSTVGRRILDSAAPGALEAPAKLPVTLEEFPSRIWKRAIASGSPRRIANAGHQAVLAMLRLYFRYEVEVEAAPPDISNLQPGQTMEFFVPSGDLPPVIDLLGIPPFTLPEMKARVLDRIMEDTTAGQFTMSAGQDAAFSAWVFADSDEGPEYIAVVLRHAGIMLEKLNDRKSLYSSHHAQRLGRLLFRLGHRRESMRCAKAVGLSPWDQGWQFQSIRGSTHARIRNLLNRHGAITVAWQSDPALACSAMSLPLWLKDPVSRMPELVKLFNEPKSFPWIFPCLHHIYQWHLSLAGKENALREIESFDPESAVGLAGQSPSHPP